jgi:predicted enzyme related to lactoylglutathione lyase
MQKENLEQISPQFVTVESIDDYVDKAQQLGAKVIKNKNEISEGYYTILEDPQKYLWNMAK